MSGKSYLYQQIYDHLVHRIESGELPVGSRLPTENELTGQFGVSRITTKKALNLMAENGYAIRRPGLGTFVIDHTKQAKKTGPSIAAIHTPDDTPTASIDPSAKILGLIMERMDESYGLELFYQIDRQAAALGYTVLLRLSYGNQKRESEALQFLVDAGAKGILIMPTHGKHYNIDLLRLVLDDFPVVMVDRNLHGIPANAVTTANVQASTELTEHLIDKGHRHIGFIMLPLGEALSLDDRLAGYQHALMRHSILIGDDWVLQSHFNTVPSLERCNSQEDIAVIYDYLKKHPAITAVISSEYNIAPMVRHAARQLGRSIPDQLAIACFDEHYDYTGSYTFTHAKQDEPELAKKAVQKIHDLIDGKHADAKYRNYTIPALFKPGKTT